MCQKPGCGQASVNQGVYGSNMWNINSLTGPCSPKLPCKGCVDIINARCTVYTGPNKPGTGIDKNDDLETIINKIEQIKLAQDNRFQALYETLEALQEQIDNLQPAS